MRDVERELKRLADAAQGDLPAQVAPRPRALKRIRLRRRVLSGSVALSVALVVAGGIVVARPREERGPVTPAREDLGLEEVTLEERVERCGAPFVATYVPPGFEAEPHPGAGGFGRGFAPTTPAHFDGGRSFIDVTVPGNAAYSPSRRQRIEVLGRHAVLGAIHEGFSVDFEIGRCGYQLLGYGVTRAELRAFAEGLVGTEERVGNWFGAVWPEDTAGLARRGCRGAGAGRRDPRAVAADFAEEMLRWPEPLVETVERGSGERTVEVMPTSGSVLESGVDPGASVTLQEVMHRCWSVTSASPLDVKRTWSLGVGVGGDIAEVVFERHGATSASVEFGYGSQTSLTHWHRGDPDVTTLHVGGRGDSTGHFLILLRDTNGDPFTAIGRPLPPGDFAAG